MPFEQKLSSGILTGINWTKTLLHKTYHHGKQALGILDHDVKTGQGIYDSLKTRIGKLAPRGSGGRLAQTKHTR